MRFTPKGDAEELEWAQSPEAHRSIMNHPQLRNNEREIGLSVDLIITAERICFILPHRQGNTIEYMAIIKGQPGFQGVLNQGTGAVKLIEIKRREKKEADDREARYKHYLYLKEEFENE